MDIVSLGKEPVSPDNPAGTDARYDPEFEQLQGEIDKLSNPSSSGGIDWKKVNQLASSILAAKSKDLLVASYLAVAQIHLNQVEGFSMGLRVYRDLVENFWDGLFPTKKRMRGRVAAIEWWLEKIETAVEGMKLPPLPADRLEGFREDIRGIDSVLREKVDEPPLLRPLERFVDSIPVAVEKKPEPQPASETAGADAVPPGVAAAQKPAPAGPQPSPAAVPSAAMDSGPIGSVGDAEKTVRNALQTIRRAGDYFQAQSLSDPRGYRWKRIAVWSMIQALPPATDGKTEIPPPANHGAVLEELNGHKANGNWEGLIRSAEEKFQTAVLWLDLTRFVADGLAGMGDSCQGAYDALCWETACLIHRLEGLASLTFADGTPLADGETQQWLRQISLGGKTAMGAQPGGAGAGDGSKEMGKKIQEALALAKKKKVGEAVAMLQDALRRSTSRREGLLWRLGLSQVLLDAKKPQLAFPHLESVMKDIEAYRLEEWDPGLALEGLKLVWLGFSARSDDAAKGQVARVLDRIAILDPVAALTLAKG